MTTRKITTFLMCPAANGDASGGTPAANAASGGHIKKSAWVHVFDAASVALFDLVVRSRERRGACDPKQDQDHEPAADEDQERGGGHGGSIPHDVGVDQEHQQDQHAANGSGSGEGKFEEGHGSLLSGELIGAMGTPSRMNADRNDVFSPREGVVRAHLAANQPTLQKALDLPRSRLYAGPVLQRPTLEGQQLLLFGGQAGEVVVHESLLVEPAQNRAHDQDHSDDCQKDLADEDEGVHGGLVRVVVEQNVDDHVQQHCNGDEDGGNGDEVGHGSDLCLLLGAQAPQLAVACLRQHDQLLTECESRLGGCTLQKIADSCLATPADRGDLHLAKTALLNA